MMFSSKMQEFLQVIFFLSNSQFTTLFCFLVGCENYEGYLKENLLMKSVRFSINAHVFLLVAEISNIVSDS